MVSAFRSRTTLSRCVIERQRGATVGASGLVVGIRARATLCRMASVTPTCHNASAECALLFFHSLAGRARTRARTRVAAKRAREAMRCITGTHWCRKTGCGCSGSACVEPRQLCTRQRGGWRQVEAHTQTSTHSASVKCVSDVGQSSRADCVQESRAGLQHHDARVRNSLQSALDHKAAAVGQVLS